MREEISEDYQRRGDLYVHKSLIDFLENKALPAANQDATQFWQGFSRLVATHMPTNHALLAKRAQLQQQIDDWHLEHGPIGSRTEAYIQFLRKIGYLEDEPQDFTIETQNLDAEITTICGPQLVVPVSNARYALNAVNARWGSLYDALYGTDALPQDGALAIGHDYNPQRGEKVFEQAANFLDQALSLTTGSHADIIAYHVTHDESGVTLHMRNQHGDVALIDDQAFIGYRQTHTAQEIIFRHHNLHIIMVIDPTHPIGQTHKTKVADIRIESAITAIQDCEDSVAAVDAEDKVAIYNNWLGLMRKSLVETFEKNGTTLTRRANDDIDYIHRNGETAFLRARSLLLVRNVGHLMMSNAILDAHKQPIGEGLMDAVITTLCSIPDLTLRQNSQTGAIYIVKPKMHGPEEVRFACQIFGDVEALLSLPANTIKIGIMDEERRTSANLKACIYEARQRVFFINTGFLDRTGDEIHTNMRAGIVLGKDAIKAENWLQSYEDRNVLIGLKCGFAHRAQIGKGMWAKPDNMADMIAQKINHPKAGANCAWVPSPTAATLHVLHYHAVDVFAMQQQRKDATLPDLSALFSMPVLSKDKCNDQHWEPQQIQLEIDNNAQGILGYVVRWVDQGIGCSKVPDIHNVALMEDRATCRISAQAIANWLYHGVVDKKMLLDSFTRMAAIVDKQNADDPNYRPMSNRTNSSYAFQAALALALEGADQPSGYTEPILHHYRLLAKTLANN